MTYGWRLRATIAARGAACALLLLRTCDAFAFFDDHLQHTASESVTHDDNVFRLSGDVDPIAVLGTGDEGDTYRTTALGLVFDVPSGAQTFRGNLEIQRTQFDHFDALDYDGHRASFDWLFDGDGPVDATAGHSESRGLASFANIQNGVQSTVPNVIDADRTYATAKFGVAPHWVVTGNLAYNTQDNSAPIYASSDLRATTGKLELAYVSTAMSRVGVDVQEIDGSLPNPELVGVLLVDNSYTQVDGGVFLEWRPRESSRLEARAGRMGRSYVDLDQRNHTEGTYRLVYAWQPGDALTFSATAQKGPSTTEEINVGYVLIQGVGLESQWRVSEGATLAFNVQRGDRTYRDDPSVALGLIPERAEQVTAAGFGGTFKLSRIVTLDFRLRHERRTSDTPGLGYNVGIADLGVRCKF